MPRTTVHMIGQAHLDPVWLWRWTEGRAEALATSQSAVDRLHEYPDFQFVRGEAQIYRWIEQENPHLLDQIVEFIRQGRWHVVNGMIVQPDMNLPQGESFVRHVLLGKAVMRERLGTEPRIAYCVDSFGHAGTLPQILKKCGFDAYVFMRPGPHEKELPAQAFWWQAPDGSRVLAFRITASYTSRTGDQAKHIQQAVDAKPTGLSHTMCFFGLGNHGGGPTRQQIENVQAIAGTHSDLDIRFSSPQAYFSSIRPQADILPVVAEELQFHAVGCYSANSALKRAHRQAECHLLVAERMAVMAQLWAGRSAPMQSLRTLWQDLCFNQFHDTLGGCSIKEAEDDTIMALGRVILGADEIANSAGRAIAAGIDTEGPGGTLVLFNPFPYPSTRYVEYEPWTEWQRWQDGHWGLLDEKGQAVVHQLIETHEALSRSDHGLDRILFQAKLPPLGYRVYRFAPGLQHANAAPVAHATPTTLQNERLSVRLDPSTGVIVSCVDKASGLELVSSRGWNVAQVLEDTSDTWSHDVRRFGKVVGHFGNARISVCDDGPLQASLLVGRSYEGSTWLQQIILRQGRAEILIRNWLHWQGRWRMIKLAFDLPTDLPQATHDVPFGWCNRPCDGAEVPTQMWMDVSGPARGHPEQRVGLALIDDGKYGCDVAGSMLRLTILRSPPYAYHQPHLPGSKKHYDWIDQGLQQFTLVLSPHAGDWRDAQVVRRAREINLPVVPITMHCHPGPRPAIASLATLSSPELELTALKPAEDGDGFIVRIADRHGRGGAGKLSWQDLSFPLTVAPREVITLRLSSGRGRWQANLCDMIEKPL
ncbi:MAG: glycoside hydrolase family 38 C-terminal domain-containing protein [Chloroflexota bacterium]|nr:glycoside hydrolase family 38 C-terminal domain-containing protein [Chloroflexota bacterium]